jgi:hypothetical protein
MCRFPKSYSVLPSPEWRVLSVLSFQGEFENNADRSSDIIQTLPTPSAILDIHFLIHVPSSNFGVATSTGSFAMYELESWQRNPKIAHLNTIQYFPEDILITAFSWHPESFMVGMTLSNGQVHLGIVDPEDDGASTMVRKQRHEYHHISLLTSRQ